MRLHTLDHNNQYNFAIWKIQDGGGSHLENSKNLRDGTSDFDEI